MPAPGTPGAQDGLRAAIDRHLGSGQVSRVVYGSIIGLALVVALQAHPPSAAAVVGSLLGTAFAVALAELYSDMLGAQTRTHRHVRRADVRHAAVDATAVAAGIAAPAVFFVLAALGALEVPTAFTWAKWTGLGLIVFYGFCAGRLAGDGVPRALLQGLGVGAIGAVLIALKAVLH
jgi:hypothetical protein